jgi:hypothetical protein
LHTFCLLASLVVPLTGAQSDAKDDLAQVDIAKLARLVGRAYRTTEFLSFDGITTERTLRPDGRMSPTRETARFSVVMGRQGQLRLVVMDPAGRTCLLNRVSDGRRTVEWNDREGRVVPPDDAGQVGIAANFKWHYVGAFLFSWLGDGEQAVLLEKHIAQGRLLAARYADGARCLVVSCDDRPAADRLIRHTFLIDADSYLVRQWTTEQTTFGTAGMILTQFTRNRQFKNLDTSPPKPETFRVPDSDSE